MAVLKSISREVAQGKLFMGKNIFADVEECILEYEGVCKSKSSDNYYAQLKHPKGGQQPVGCNLGDLGIDVVTDEKWVGKQVKFSRKDGKVTVEWVDQRKLKPEYAHLPQEAITAMGDKAYA